MVKQDFKYLVVQLDWKLLFTSHGRLVATKADKAIQRLSRIMLNVSGDNQNSKILISYVVHSFLLNGSPA
jgi:hypothetical protein